MSGNFDHEVALELSKIPIALLSLRKTDRTRLTFKTNGTCRSGDWSLLADTTLTKRGQRDWNRALFHHVARALRVLTKYAAQSLPEWDATDPDWALMAVSLGASPNASLIEMQALATLHVVLSDEQLWVLEALASLSRRDRVNAESLKVHRVGVRAKKVILKQLESFGLACRPAGAKLGYATTDRGRDRLTHEERQKKLHAAHQRRTSVAPVTPIPRHHGKQSPRLVGSPGTMVGCVEKLAS